MLREFILWISEGLFHLQGGEMLINTPWIFVWIVFWTLIIILPIHCALLYIRKLYLVAPFAFVAFFLGPLMAIGPGILQQQMMQECETVESVVATEHINPTVITLKQCRTKDNYYGDFGEWKIVGQVQ